MSITDQLRIESAVLRYDFWLDYRGVRGRRRRELRRELRANLAEATALEGSRAAVLGIGSPRAMAYAATEGDGRRARWTFGVVCAGVVWFTLSMMWLFSVIGFLDGVDASGVEGRDVSGTSFPWGGAVSAHVTPGHGGLSLSATYPWSILALVALTFLLTAQPWRLVTGRRRGAQAAPAKAVAHRSA